MSRLRSAFESARRRGSATAFTSSSKSPALQLNQEDFFLRVLTSMEVPRLIGEGTEAVVRRAITKKREEEGREVRSSGSIASSEEDEEDGRERRRGEGRERKRG